jgi:hypothetical protein
MRQMRLARAIRLLPRCWGDNSLLKRRGFILVCSHMRARTTLLSHIVGSHPSVCGYAELHQKLRGWPDLLELSAKAEDASGKCAAGRHVLDKIVHDLPIRRKVLDRDDTSIVIMVRAPVQTIRSILETQSGGIDDLDGACDYYASRLASLRDLIERRQGRVFYMDSEALLAETVETLSALGSYLGIAPGLSEDYRLFKHTGRPKYGDMSKKIMAGRIVRVEESAQPTFANAHRLQEMRSIHESFRQFARANTQHHVFA